MTNDAMRTKLCAVANLLADLTSAVAEIAAEFGEVTREEAKPEKKFTLEDVRKALAEKSGAGFTAEVRALLQKHGGSKLSEIDEAEYPALMEEVREIGSTQ